MLTLAVVLEALTGSPPQELLETGSASSGSPAIPRQAWQAISGPAAEITEAAVDSREAAPGSLFVALPGERVDGHDYVEEAFARGALCALIQRDLASRFPVIDLRAGRALETGLGSGQMPEPPFCLRVEDSLKALQEVARLWRRRLNLRVVGITGSVGKSTTKELTAEVLSQRYRTLKNQGNLNNEIGLPLTILKLTPEHERAVLEMGFYLPGEISFLCDLAQPQVGVITNVGTVHAERAGSQEAIARGKAELARALPPAPEGVAVLNYDDPWVREMARETRAAVLFYGLDERADLWADRIAGQGLEGISFRLHYRHETLHLRVPLIGQHSVHTALRAAAVGLVEGLTWQEIVGGLRTGKAQLRLVAVRSESGALILDDTYNASPESTLAALNLLDDLDPAKSGVEGRKVAVLGDMLELGPYEQRGHAMVGVRAAEVADELVTVGGRGHLIAAAARGAGLRPNRIHEFEDSQQAIGFLRERLGAGDVVLVKGSRGMRMDLIVGALEGGPGTAQA
jgi:UDP-N-acetylmuramoyl-tripeptide--D-alanyl-D-alanine ligase